MKTKDKVIEVQMSSLKKYQQDPECVFCIMYMIFRITLNIRFRSNPDQKLLPKHQKLPQMFGFCSLLRSVFN